MLIIVLDQIDMRYIIGVIGYRDGSSGQKGFGITLALVADFVGYQSALGKCAFGSWQKDFEKGFFIDWNQVCSWLRLSIVPNV